MEVIDLGPGLWVWRLRHPGWREGLDWQAVVTSVCVDAGDERWLIDPLLPPDDATEVWDRLAARPPTAVAVLLPDHMRPTSGDRRVWSVDALVRRFGCRAFGPNEWDPDMGPAETAVEKIVPGEPLPGGLIPFRDPRGWHETPLWLPAHRTLVVGDTLTERKGALRVWMSPTHEDRAIPDLRTILELPLERVIISHGAPIHPRAALEHALRLPPWPATSLHISAWKGDVDQVRHLLQRGADPTAPADDTDQTPLDWALNASSSAGTRRPTHAAVIALLRATTPCA